MVHERPVFITDYDLERLNRLIDEASRTRSRDGKHIQELKAELAKAVVVKSKEIPTDVVTMNSQVILSDLDSGSEVTLFLRFPQEANPEEGGVSILAPIGTAIIGCRIGDEVDWQVPAGRRRLKVENILYQPESAGDYHL